MPTAARCSSWATSRARCSPVRRSNRCKRCRWSNPVPRIGSVSPMTSWRSHRLRTRASRRTSPWSSACSRAPASMRPRAPVVERARARAARVAAARGCGAPPPIHAPSAQALARSGREPSALHNNCSGKHAGFLCFACATAADPAGYPDPAHPVQRAVKAALEGIAGVALDDRNCAIDGCSAPTWALPLEKLAHGFARFGSGRGLDPHRAEAAARIRAACAARPYLVAGTGRFCTRIMAHFGGRVLVKGGAEGVLCGALPEAGIGVAIKCDDGAARAAEVAMAALISRLLALDDADRAALAPLVRPALRNWNGIEVGALRPSGLLAQRT